MLVRVALVVLLLVGCKDRREAPPPKPAPAPAAPADAATAKRALAEELEAIRSEAKLPALAAAAWRDGKLVEIDAVGLRKADDPSSKVSTKDLWHLGSNTKAMTATLIGIYVDRGVVHWDDTIGKVFGKVDPGYAKVTIDQLLRHEGGAPGKPPDELWKQLWADADTPGARARFVKGILARPPAQSPGTFVYSNAGYMIAGAMLEKLTGKRWEQLTRDELFAKLGMTTCGFGAPGRRDVVDQPWGHDAGGTPIPPGPAADNPPGLGPAGTVHCSLEDYGKFLALHATGEPALVTAATLEHLHTPSPGGHYAGGWLVIDSPRGQVIAHSGSNTMWYLTAMVEVSADPKGKLAVVMATNSGDDTIERTFERVLKRYVATR